MAKEGIMENMQRVYRMVALGVTVFYVAIVLVPFTVVLIARRVLTEGPLEHAANAVSTARTGMASGHR